MHHMVKLVINLSSTTEENKYTCSIFWTISEHNSGMVNSLFTKMDFIEKTHYYVILLPK